MMEENTKAAMGDGCAASPLRIVLGAFANGFSSSASPSKFCSCEALPSATAISGESPASNILGTSYFADPRVGSSRGRMAVRLNKDGRVMMEDRKGALDHFRPKSLLLSTVRVTAINISTTMSKYFSDQLSFEQKVEKEVDTGIITAREADKKNDEWESREWQVRMDALPQKIGFGLLRFHACTALMRFYEFVMARYVLRVAERKGDNNNVVVLIERNSSSLSQEQAINIMDKLTRDPYQASIRTSQILHNSEHAPRNVISSSTNGTETSTNRELAKRMFTTCIWANIIPFLAELTVQQGVLIYGYGMYYMAKHKRKKRRKDAVEGEVAVGEGETDVDECNEEEKHDETAYALSLFFRSCHLSVSKAASWAVASAGGAVGSVLLPGWGTVFGIQVGDSIAGAIFDSS